MQIRSTPLEPGLQALQHLFNCPLRGIMPAVNRLPFDVNNNDEYYKALVKRQTKNDNNHDTSRNYALIPIGSTVTVY